MRKAISPLIVDDEPELRRGVRSLLEQELSGELELNFSEAANGLEAIEKVSAGGVDLVIMDVRMPGMSGLQALEKIKAIDPSVFIVIMTAHGNLNDAVQAIREGAYDYLEKPVNIQKLAQIIRKCVEARQMVKDLEFSNPIFDDDVDSEFVGQSQKMRTVFELIYKLGKVDTTVLIRGENGTGKELVARAIHYNSSRKSGPFIAVNCGALPENLVESEFFGHEKGAFTGATERKIGHFQQANNGTLFLDEIGELRPEMQVKFLRVLQEKKFFPVGSSREIKSNARIIAATNRNLERMIQEGSFREDLFYRLNVMPIYLPPLRDRKDDIDALVQSFIRKFQKQHTDSPLRGIEPEALLTLKKHRWPGNIRELENVIERAFIVESSPLIRLSSLPDHFHDVTSSDQAPRALGTNSGSESLGASLDYETFKEMSEKEFVISALKANKGRINQTVAQANIPKNTLLRKIKKYGINVKEISGQESSDASE